MATIHHPQPPANYNSALRTYRNHLAVSLLIRRIGTAAIRIRPITTVAITAANMDCADCFTRYAVEFCNLFLCSSSIKQSPDCFYDISRQAMTLPNNHIKAIIDHIPQPKMVRITTTNRMTAMIAAMQYHLIVGTLAMDEFVDKSVGDVSSAFDHEVRELVSASSSP